MLMVALGLALVACDAFAETPAVDGGSAGPGPSGQVAPAAQYEIGAIEAVALSGDDGEVEVVLRFDVTLTSGELGPDPAVVTVAIDGGEPNEFGRLASGVATEIRGTLNLPPR